MGNIGKKIRMWSTVLTVVGFVVIAMGFMVVCLLSVNRENGVTGFGIGVLLMGIGVGISWLSSFILYTLGECLEQTAATSLASPSPFEPIFIRDNTVRMESDKGSFSVAIPVGLQPYVHAMPSLEYPQPCDSLALVSTLLDDGYMMTPLFTFYTVPIADEEEFKERWNKRAVVLNETGVAYTSQAMRWEEGFRLVKLSFKKTHVVYAEYLEKTQLNGVEPSTAGYNETLAALDRKQDIFQSFRWETTV